MIEIMADIMNISTSGTRKTHLMYGANLSYEQVLRYLEKLQGEGFIQQGVEEGHTVYRTTEKGRMFLDHFSKVTELMTKHPEEPAARYKPSLVQ